VSTPVKILVVDDEPDLELLIRQKFRRQIRAGEFEFFFAHNGLEALARMRDEPGIELVLTDINMPQMDGLSLLVKLGELAVPLKAVIVSAYGDMVNIRTAMNRGAADFLTKPIDLNDLEITVGKTIAQLATLKQSLREHDQLLALRHELDIAASIQQSILPRSFPAFPDRKEFDLYAAMLPAREVGGDFYDFFLVDDDHLGVVVADVSGKGVPAALFMAMSRTLLKATALEGVPPGECLQRVNSRLCLDNRSEMFVTVFYGILDTRTGAFEYGNGGHNAPYLRSRSGAVEALERTGDMVLAAMSDTRYRTKRADLEPGDHLLLFTDGVTEAMDGSDELFGDERLRTYLRERGAASPQPLIEGLIQTVRNFAGERDQSDDLTALAVEYAPR
jgi:sigma-B regulation protein RsbU (phosphoserine phosphatase)